MMHYLPPLDPLRFPSLSLDLSLTVLTPYLPFKATTRLPSKSGAMMRLLPNSNDASDYTSPILFISSVKER